MCVIDWCIQVLTNSVMRISNHIYMTGGLFIYLRERGGGGGVTVSPPSFQSEVGRTE